MRKRTLVFSLLFLFLLKFTAELSGTEGWEITAKTDHGILARLDGERQVLFLEGTAEEMGRAHGELMKEEIGQMAKKIALVGTAYTVEQKISFVEKISEAQRRCSPFTPERYFREMDAMADSSSQTKASVRRLNFFPEMFHCSGIAVRGKGTIDGNVRHARVLDYMRDIGIQDYAAAMLFMPSESVNGKKFNAWVSISYPGFIGTVTCMNEKGLVMGEMGGRGEGFWDGIPMTFLMRRVMEECGTVEEAVSLLQSVPQTCIYYYVLSDAENNIAAAVCDATDHDHEKVHIIRPNEDYPDWMPNGSVLPFKDPDAVYISGKGERIETLGERLKANFGQIDTQTMIEMIKRPVCMKSNLHNAVFEPVTRDFYFAEAKKKALAADEKYFKGNILGWMKFYNENKK